VRRLENEISPNRPKVSDLDFAEFTAEDRRIVLNLRSWGLLHNFQQVVLVSRVLVTLHNQYVFETLVIFGTVFSWTVTHTIELVTF